MVGREILARAAVDPRFERVLCLMRPPLDRLGGLLAAYGVTKTDHITGLAGDVTEPRCGLVDRRPLAGVTHVLHCAATVAFDHPLDEARRINVGGTAHV